MSKINPKRVVRRHFMRSASGEWEQLESYERVAYDWGPFAEDRESDKDGNYMSVQNMKDIHTISGQLAEQIQSGDQMEDWVEDKISAARQILSDLERFYNKGWASKR
tara:strand:+ start:113 stop:433 length:321 start_codon:yes stop_codon:yes gene_type:complete